MRHEFDTRQLQRLRAMRHHRQRPRRLQRQLFWSFGVAILMTIVVTSGVLSLAHAALGPRPWLRMVGLFAAGNVLWVLSGFAARRIARPLRELSQAARDFGDGKLERRVRMRFGAREIRELGSNFNDMAARIEAQVKSQRELLGAVSHELRTPLTRLRVLLDVLAERATDAQLVANMEREIVEMDALVGELLAGARVDAGALQTRDLDVHDLVRISLERTGLTGGAIDIAGGLSVVHGDATLLSRALIVLLDNTKKHGGGNVQVRVDTVDGHARFAVEDDGRGFDPADIARLFSPFARGAGATPDESRGLGLGLYLVRRIAEAHGGTVWAENRPQGGARVGFSLPRRTYSETSSNARPSAATA